MTTLADVTDGDKILSINGVAAADFASMIQSVEPQVLIIDWIRFHGKGKTMVAYGRFTNGGVLLAGPANTVCEIG